MELTTDADGEVEDVSMAAASSPAAAADLVPAAGSAQEPASKRPSRPSQLSREDSVDMMSENESYAASNAANLSPPSGSSNSSATPASGLSESAPLQSTDAPPIDQQVTIIRDLSQVPLTEGMVGYVISNRWLQDAQDRVDESKKSITDPLPPVDLRDFVLTSPFSDQLVNELGEIFYPLKPGLTIGEEIQVLPREAWDKIIKWHGIAEGSPMVRRFCHNTSTGPGSENLLFELYPPVFTLMKLPDTSNGLDTKIIQDREMQAPRKAVSRSEPYEKVLKEMKEAANIPLAEEVRLWRVLNSVTEKPQQSGMMSPEPSRSNSPAPNTFDANLGDKLVIDVNKFSILQDGSQRELVEIPDTVDKPSSAPLTVDDVGLGQEGTLILEQRIGGPAGGEWVSDSVSSKASKFGIKTLASGKSRSAVSSGRTSPAPGMQTRGRTQRQGRTRGTVGLANLGNTCYMNSALQCVKSVKELTTYFLEGKYGPELNPNNPLGHHGDVARAYADLIKQLFAANGTSFSPRQFKSTIGRYGPSFSGYGQQDSQEFLLFLLDGLQEDLNRIHKKPYIEKPDSTDEMVHNEAALKAFADRCWEIYKARNDSVITDLFAGMYKSTVKCPVCDKVSIIFDPFNNLTLQLPIENAFTRTITFYPLNLLPIEVDVDIDKNATFAQLKDYIGTKVSVDPKKLVLAEIYKSRFFKMYDDRQSISEDRIQSSDQVCCFELENVPTNYPPSKNQARTTHMLDYFNNDDNDEDSEAQEADSAIQVKMLVPIFHRGPKEQAYTQKEIMEAFGEPSYIVLSNEEAKDEEAIMKKIIANVATMTTKDILEQGDESDGQGSDTVLLSRDDAESLTDSKIQAQSVQSEDGVVDVSMKDAEEAITPRISYPPPPRLKRTLPTVLESGNPLPAQFKSLFQLKYCNDGSGGSITTGWTAIGDGKLLPSLASRLPKPPKQTKPHNQNIGAKLKRRIKNGGSGGESSEDDSESVPTAAHTSSVQSSAASDEDEEIPVEQLSAPKEEAPVMDIGPQLVKSSKPLIRPGEGIVCDWNSDSYSALFHEGSIQDDDDFRGAPTWTQQRVTLPDPEVDRKRQIRNARKRDGVSLIDCLEEFGKEEILSENDAWYCPRCKEHRRASKKFELWKAPDILVIHLKRFSAHGRLRDKLDVTVDFPTEGLDLSSRVAMHDDKELIYDLFAVDNHYGGLGGGHYTAYAQSFGDGAWYDYNDSIATRVSPDQTVTRAAYLLFYRRRSDKPLGGPFFENLFNEQEGETEATSSPQSRTQSPSQAGEGRRLDDFSRTGLSSAYQEVGVAHQAGGGGHQAKTTAGSMTDLDDELPSYSDAYGTSIDGMDLDDTATSGNRGTMVTWNGFGALGANEDDEQSTGVSSTGAIRDDGDSMRSGTSDNGFAPGTPVDDMAVLSDVHALPEVNISAAPLGDGNEDDLDDTQVAEVRLEGDDAKAKSD